jgi:hypothetical protein
MIVEEGFNAHVLLLGQGTDIAAQGRAGFAPTRLKTRPVRARQGSPRKQERSSVHSSPGLCAGVFLGPAWRSKQNPPPLLRIEIAEPAVPIGQHRIVL